MTGDIPRFQEADEAIINQHKEKLEQAKERKTPSRFVTQAEDMIITKFDEDGNPYRVNLGS